MTNRKFFIVLIHYFIDFFIFLKAPIVNSLSYAMTEATVNHYLGNDYIQRSDYQFQVLAVM